MRASTARTLRWLGAPSSRRAAIAQQRRALSETAASEERKVTVYTRTGDKGTSSLFDGTRCAKSDAVFHALGMTDSLNAHLGLAREQFRGVRWMGATGPEPEAVEVIREELEVVQCTLIDLGAAVATPPSASPDALARVRFDGDAHGTAPPRSLDPRPLSPPTPLTAALRVGRAAAELEGWIDAHELTLPPLRTFVLPGGCLCAAQLHIARTVARETERTLVRLAEQQPELEPSVLRYANRLSDYLFVAARVAVRMPPPWGGEERAYRPCQPAEP